VSVLPWSGLRSRTLGLGAGVLFLVVLAGNPLLHHDLACHQRTPGHCDACLSTPLAPRVAEVAIPFPPQLPPAEPIEGTGEKLPRPPLSSPSSGRSPPA
jgi:hypothetical protein